MWSNNREAKEGSLRWWLCWVERLTASDHTAIVWASVNLEVYVCVFVLAQARP